MAKWSKGKGCQGGKGRGRGGGRGKGRGDRRDHDGWHAPFDSEKGKRLEEKATGRFRAYYRAQRLVDAGEFEQMVATFREPLPATFR